MEGWSFTTKTQQLTENQMALTALVEELNIANAELAEQKKQLEMVKNSDAPGRKTRAYAAGIGIKPQNMNNLFKPFVQLENGMWLLI